MARKTRKTAEDAAAVVTVDAVEAVESLVGPETPKRRGRKKAVAVPAAPLETETPVSTPRKRQPTRAAKKRKLDEDGDTEATVLVKQGEQSGEESDLTPFEDTDDGGDGSPSKTKPKKARKPRKPREPKPEPVYDIPPVKTLPTTFRGRLGYACLNTILRNKKPAKDAMFCSRTCRIATMQEGGVEVAKALGLQNTRDLLQLVEWNEHNNIRFMRVSSEMFPFASHKQWGYSLEYARAELEAVGNKAREYGHRLTTHPGQFTQLGSPREEVIENAIRDLEYHCDMLDLMGMGADSVMIIHGGGTYGDKDAAIARLKDNIANRLPARVRARLVLENDEMCFSAEDLLPICEELDVPLVFDYHHDWIRPSSFPPREIIERANAIFARRGIRPKQHLSSPRPGAVTVMEKRAHANRCETFPPDLPDDVDLMIEAKDKEQAVLHLYRIYQLQPIVWKSLRPPAEKEALATNGRKSAKKRKRKDDEDEDGDEDVDYNVLAADEGEEGLVNAELAVAEVPVNDAAATAATATSSPGASAGSPAASPKRTPRKRKSQAAGKVTAAS
ncbi:UV-endonuclease UvdE [Auricularia subglabra TFB-10046 SS5]|nr:UV-endonuclease UvdE [Auricularia subglabra TFB-10046 SS5]